MLFQDMVFVFVLVFISLFALGIFLVFALDWLARRRLIKRPRALRHGVEYIDFAYDLDFDPGEGQPTKKYIAKVTFCTFDKEKLCAALADGNIQFILFIFMERAIRLGCKYPGALRADGSIVLDPTTLPPLESIEDEGLRRLLDDFLNAYRAGLGTRMIFPTMVIFYPFKT